jgi:NitT/TauT family transport system substrate-binding protein
MNPWANTVSLRRLLPRVAARGAASRWVPALLLGILGACAPAPAAPAAAPATPARAAMATAATAAAPSATVAPAARDARSEPTTLRISDFQIASQAGSYIAAEKGYLREEGIELEFTRVNPADMIPAMVSNSLEVGITSVSAALFNSFARGITLKVVADHGSNLPGASAGGIVVRSDLVASGAYRQPADLRGRKIGAANPGSVAEVTLDRYLQSAGLTLADVDIVTLNYPDIMTAFENRAIEASYYQEPFTTMAVERGLVVRGPIGYDIVPDQQIGVVMFGDRMLQDPGLSRRYLRGYVRGVRDYVRGLLDRDPATFDEVVSILIARTTVKDRGLFERAIPSGLNPDPLPNLASMQDSQEWFLAHGSQTQRINVADIVDTSGVEAAIRELGPARR